MEFGWNPAPSAGVRGLRAPSAGVWLGSEVIMLLTLGISLLVLGNVKLPSISITTPIFTDRETEAPSWKATCPRSHHASVAGRGMESKRSEHTRPLL